jgi:hypothetical protein
MGDCPYNNDCVKGNKVKYVDQNYENSILVVSLEIDTRGQGYRRSNFDILS